MAPKRMTFVVTVALLGTCLLNACYQAKTPDQVAKDTAAAENTAAENTAKVEQAAGDKVTSAQGVVNDQQATAAHTLAVEGERVADAKAQGNQPTVKVKNSFPHA